MVLIVIVLVIIIVVMIMSDDIKNYSDNKKTIAINTNRNITIIIIITERITVITAILPIILITSNTNI